MQFGIEVIFQVIMENQAGTRPIPRTQSGGLISFSRIASFVFHPLLMTSIAAFAIYRFAPDDFSNFPFPEFKKWFPQLLLYTVLFPIIFIFIFRISGLISNINMDRPRDRFFLCWQRIFFIFLLILFLFLIVMFPYCFKYYFLEAVVPLL
jgi:hypothetical protein